MIKNGKFQICLECNKEFYLPKCLLNKRIYCSKICYTNSQKGKKQSKELIQKRVEKLRIPCSESKKKKISQTLMGHSVSEKTRNKISKAQYVDGRSFIYSGKALYGDDWDMIRRMALVRDKFTCQHCMRMGKKLDVHHKVPFLLYFDNSLDNLLCLCRSCHMKEENKLKRKYKHLIKKQRENLNKWLLDNNIFSRVLITKKIKIKLGKVN